MPLCKKIAGTLAAAVTLTALGACTTMPDGSTKAIPTRGPNLGVTAPAAMLAAMDISIPPSGEGLPGGSGNVAQGQQVYDAKCQACHGPKGVGKPADPLVGGKGSLASGKPMRTVGSYWPYATTLFDYTRRAMPTTAPMSLTDEEVYAVTAYVLFLNGIVPESAVMNAQSLPQVKMPNRDGFIDYSRK
jgi:S-disulfanyl-L-cysteine oxidoreductase SoxD